MFTVEEANDLVPDLELAFGRLGRLRGEASVLVEALGGGERAMEVLNGGTPNPGLEAHASRLAELVEEQGALPLLEAPCQPVVGEELPQVLLVQVRLNLPRILLKP